MLNVQLLKSIPANSKHLTLVAFATASKGGKNEIVKLGAANLQKRFAEALSDKEITGKSGETVFFRDIQFENYKNILIVGVGSASDHESIRQLAPTVYSALSSLKIQEAVVQFDGIPGAAKNLQAFVEGLILSSFSFDELKSKKKEDKKENTLIHLVTKLAGSPTAKHAFAEATILAESVNFSRRLGDLPGNLMTPSILADEAVAACKGIKGVKAIYWDKARIKREKMGGLLGVSMGSDEEPRFIVLEYNGAAKGKKPVVLVGKGLTFDCGGVSIKPGSAMEEMKYDMCGGANVIGAFVAAAKLRLKVNLVCLVPSTENMINGRATKPGDVHIARNGKSFEVNNTDAEGRLILADALSYASELKPQVIVDAATLTGAIVVALGNMHTGYFTRNEALTKKIEQAAKASGEWVWRMPLTDFHVKDMKGTYADLSNISAGKGAGSATAAAFLEQFVEEGIPWAHFDIAGTAWANGNRFPYNPKKGASGAMLRTFVEFIKLYK